MQRKRKALRTIDEYRYPGWSNEGNGGIKVVGEYGIVVVVEALVVVVPEIFYWGTSLLLLNNWIQKYSN